MHTQIVENGRVLFFSDLASLKNNLAENGIRTRLKKIKGRGRGKKGHNNYDDRMGGRGTCLDPIISSNMHW